MRLLLTTSQSFLLLDTDNGESYPLDRGHGLYYGIARNNDRIYVAARNRLVSSDVPQQDEHAVGRNNQRALRRMCFIRCNALRPSTSSGQAYCTLQKLQKLLPLNTDAFTFNNLTIFSVARYRQR